MTADRIASWDGTSWRPLAGGDFDSAGGVPAAHVARWDGTSWYALADGVTSQFSYVNAFSVYDEGDGPSLFMSGRFDDVDGQPMSDIARWDGTAWSPVGTGLMGDVQTLAVFEDAYQGDVLCVGGSFGSTRGPGFGLDVDRIAGWDGSTYTPLAGGLDGQVRAVVVHDDGLVGPALYFGGEFTMGSMRFLDRVAGWSEDEGWIPLGDGADSTVHALQSFEGELLAAGTTGVIRWDGSSWTPLNGLVNGPARALEVFDDGTGPALFAGGALYDRRRPARRPDREVGWYPVVAGRRRAQRSRLHPGGGSARRFVSRSLRGRAVCRRRRQPGAAHRALGWQLVARRLRSRRRRVVADVP